MYADGIQIGTIRHYELEPDEEKIISFIVEKEDIKQLLFVTKYKSVLYDMKPNKTPNH